MHLHTTALRRSALALAAGAALTLTACKDPAGPDDHEPHVESMRITIAGQAPVTVSSSGVPSGTLTIAAGVPTTFTVEFLDESGAPDDHLEDEGFEVSVAPGAGITFARTGAFTGTLTGAAGGTVAVNFGLYHIAEAHNDFGPFAVSVTITP